MGLRGPAPTPTVLRLLEGNRSHRPVNTLEPKPERVMPKAPKELDAIAKREWKKWAAMLMRIGVMTEADEISLANLCMCRSRLLQADAIIQREGLEITDSKGAKRRHPMLKVANDAQQQVDRLSIQFGLTPASRTRIVTSGLEGIDTHMGSLGRKMAAGRKERPAS